MKIKPILVLPSLPERISRLQELAQNVWYAWSPNLVKLFQRLDPDCWMECNRNPVQMLARVSQEKLREAAEDESFVAHVDRVYGEFNNYMAQKKWFETRYSTCKDATIAYFSCEYGLDVSLPIYSGGLGVLSGDHLKSASDLGIPIVAIGLLYRFGYFKQTLNADGWQNESYDENDWYNMPVKLEKDKDDKPLTITIYMGDTPVYAQIWRVQVGRVPLYLLDTNISENSSVHREITYQLYSGDKDIRIRQEILLGIGGVRALEALGYKPSAYHLNEGHSMFLCLERIRQLMNNEKLSYDEAFDVVWSTNVFTTHTPVPAGNEQFDVRLVEKYLKPMASKLGIPFEQLINLGRVYSGNSQESFSMTVGALHMSAFANGVSKLHGAISRDMWKNVWKDFPVNDIPISSITNGVHTYSWIARNLGELYRTYLGPRYIEQPEDSTCWDSINRIPDGELWRAHHYNKEKLVFFTRSRLKKQFEEKGKSQQELRRTEQILNPHALTIGFARRFAAYKRGYLLFSDLDRLRKMISDKEHPVQFIFAGKAHPKDNQGKEIIKSVIHIANQEEFRNHIVFLENYDLYLASRLVAGVDVWLNTPRRPQEASGTSGMKAAMNGAINLSILDGWWEEGYNRDTGWAIGTPIDHANNEEQDYIESQALYNALEQDVIPKFYERHNSREASDYSHDWVNMMKNSIIMGGKDFSSHRMLKEYSENFYVPAIQAFSELAKDKFMRAHSITDWRKRISLDWKKVSVDSIKLPDFNGSSRVGQSMLAEIEISLGKLAPEDVKVEIVRGRLNAQDQLIDTEVFTATLDHSEKDGHYIYNVDMVHTQSGRLGITARIIPNNQQNIIKHHPRLVTWLDDS